VFKIFSRARSNVARDNYKIRFSFDSPDNILVLQKHMVFAKSANGVEQITGHKKTLIGESKPCGVKSCKPGVEPQEPVLMVELQTETSPLISIVKPVFYFIDEIARRQ